MSPNRRRNMYRAHILPAVAWRSVVLPAAAIGAVLAVGAGWAREPGGVSNPETAGSSGKGELYVVATSHLDTQWRWTIQKTIEEYLPATLHDNFALLAKYPGYTFSFEGAFRYGLVQEYYPDAFARLKREIAAGRWRVAGSWLDAVDVNIPAPESLIRHALYGNGYFRREFGVTSRDVYLPDCFGFGFALPSVAAHCGLLGFSSQKLTWGSAVGVPFAIGLWEGVDGSTLIAALDPGAYVSRITSDLSADSTWAARVAHQKEQSGLAVGLKYFGTGDTGGAPDEESVTWLERSLSGTGPLQVRSVGSDQLASDLHARLTPEQRARLPRYRGELLMTSHGAGCYTSQAAMKRWNRRNEILADAAERAAVAAHWLGTASYPREQLREIWCRFLWHQFHDDLTGTSIPEAYTFSWNDELLAQNQFASVLTTAAAGICRALDTRVKGEPLVVFNPLAREREDLVEAEVVFSAAEPAEVRVFSPAGDEVPAQVTGRDGRRVRVVFVASVPAAGFAVYDVRPAKSACALQTGLSCQDQHLENSHYRLTFDESGNIASIFDKQSERELLSGPVVLQLLDDIPEKWAAWEVDYDDVMSPPRQVSDGVWPQHRVEAGPARVTLESRRTYAGSEFIQKVSLAAGAAGDRIEVTLDIDWRSPATLLKVAFPLAVQNELATYDLGLGTITRGVNTARLYEVPAQRWADMTAADTSYGVAVISDSRYGWDRPDANTLRLTLVHTPGVNPNWRWVADQESQDLGHHQLTYALYGHAGDWRAGQVPWQADRLNQPLVVFQTTAHAGSLGRTFSLLRLESESQPATNVALRALKLAEETNEIVVRLQELTGEATGPVHVVFAGAVVEAREVNGAEEPMGTAQVVDGRLVAELSAYQPRTFAVRLAPSPPVSALPTATPLALPFNLDGISRDDDRTDGDFDGEGNNLAGELLPATVVFAGIPFRTGPQEAGRANVLVCEGQRLQLPEDTPDHLYVLAAAAGGGRRITFHLDERPVSLWIQDYATPVGQWDNRLAGGGLSGNYAGLTPAYINRDPVAWVGTHRHTGGQNEAYRFTYLFCYRLPVPRAARNLVLPRDERIRILAATAVRDACGNTSLACDLFDRCPEATVAIRAPRRAFLDSLRVALWSPNPDPVIRYTLDGSDPTATSAIYTAPLLLRESCRVTARTYAPGLAPSRPVQREFSRLVPRRAAKVAGDGHLPGLLCMYYEGEWRELPDFDALLPVRVDSTRTVAVPEFARAENIGLVLRGFIDIPREGLYTFHLWSDDGSALYLGRDKIIVNDGLHGRAAETAEVALAEGQHALRVHFFQRLGGIALDLWWEGPDIPLQRVPPAAFSHAP